MKANMSGMALSRAVDWKLFELQSRLVSEEAKNEDVTECIEWFQARHYNEVVEERAADSRCGYPLCNKHITIHSNQQFRINYSDKEIYKVENSVFYCSNDCLMKSITLEKSLSTEMPTSRPIVRSLDPISVKSNINELLEVLGGQTTIGGPIAKKEISDEPPPQYCNNKIEDSGKIVNSVNDCPQSNINTSQTVFMSGQQVSELLAKVDETKESSVVTRDIIADRAATLAATADLSVDDILNKMKLIKERKQLETKQLQSTSELQSESLSDNAVKDHMKGVNKREQQWTEPNQSIVEAKKAVRFQSSINSAKLEVGERPPTKVKPLPIMSKIGSVMERNNPQPMSLNAMMLKQETQSTERNVSEVEPNPMSIEGFVASIKSVRVAPSTTIKNLSYDPFQHRPDYESSVSGTDLPDASSTSVEEHDFEGNLDDLDDQEDEVETTDSDYDDDYNEDELPCSLFLSVWTVLDDLFGNVQMDVVEEAVPQFSVNSTNENNTTMTGRLPIATEHQNVQSAILKLLERGIKSAERLLDVSKYVTSKAEINVYYITKNRFLNNINKRLVNCPSLKSSGWTLIGILLIDGILSRKNLLSGMYNGPLWTTTVDSMAAAALGGGHIAGSLLRMDDLKILRSFFTDL